MRKLAIVAAAVLVLVTVIGVAGPSEADVRRGNRLEVVAIKGVPTNFAAIEISTFPTVVSTIEARTSEGPVVITGTIDSFLDDVLYGATPNGTAGELIVLTEVWDFGAGHTIRADTRIHISPVVVTGTCSELIPNDMVAVITGGTGRFENASGHIQTVIDPFCFDDVGPLPVDGVISGLVVVPTQRVHLCHGIKQLRTIIVPQGEVARHLDHGDSIGKCEAGK